MEKAVVSILDIYGIFCEGHMYKLEVCSVYRDIKHFKT